MAPRVKHIVERLADDDYLHAQLGDGAKRMGAAYRRARTLRRQEAVQDKKLYEHVREAAGSLAEAGRRLAGKPEPEPKRRFRRLPAVLLLAGVAALVRSMHRQEQTARRSTAAPATQ
jgi:hypothetical protein